MWLDTALENLPLLAQMKTRRSAGVPVTAAVHRHIVAGNVARGLKAWIGAAQAYGAALDKAPELAHIWIQRGHALKEAGELPDAVACYMRARELNPLNSEPHLHLGHIAKLRGDPGAAHRHYLDAARLQPPSADALAELRSLIMKGAKLDMNQLNEIIRDLDQQKPVLDRFPFGREDEAAEGESLRADADRTCLVFDVSDLIAYFNHARTPSGIQRVQLETIGQALGDNTQDVRICAFHEARDEWIELPGALFLELCGLTRAGSDEAWTACLTRLTLRLSVAEPFAFPRGALLVNLGTSWWIPNYFMFVRRAKEEAGIRYVPFVHDLIPLVRPDLCPPLLARDFMAWIVSVLDHADFYLVNSQSTRRDLMQVSAYLKRPIEDERIEVVPLNAVPEARKMRASRSALSRNGLQRGGYALIVSTIEPRKNHILAFEAWSKLIELHGARRVPKLVCVGNSGWMNEPIHEYLNARTDLQSRVLILSHVPDEDLDELYQGCLFTLYPSNYEGWGLPITESLGHGKVPLCARTSSLPEAGGAFADYFSLDSRAELIAAIERLAFDAGYRQGREQNIARNFKPRTWSDIAQQILRSVLRWNEKHPEPALKLPYVEPGRYYSLSRNLAPRFWPGLRSTESLRAGSSWWGRDPWGCWTKPGGGTLRFTVPDATKAHRLYLDLLGMPNMRCELRIDANGYEGLEEAILEPNELKWLSVEIPGGATADQPVTIDLVCETFEDLNRTTDGGDARAIAVGVRGFYLCNADDAAARMALLEAVTLSSIDSLSSNRPPTNFTSLKAYMENTTLPRINHPPIP